MCNFIDDSPLATGLRQIATPSAGSGKRNPHIYVGRYVTLTRRNDGSACLNFRTLPELGRELSVVEYA